MATKLNAMLSQDSGTVTPEHDMRWNDQSAGGHAPITLTSAFATFAGASFTVTGDTSGTGTTISSISTTGRIVAGMTITGTGVPAATTVVSVDSGTAITISNALNGSGGAGTTLTLNAAGANVSDPVLVLGYNRLPSGVDIESGKGQAALQIEGHYDRGATGDVWMEAFFSFKGATASGVSRPFFFAYDKETNKPQDVELAPGVGQKFLISHEDVLGDAASETFSVSESQIAFFPKTAATDSDFRLGSVAGQGSNIYLGTDGDDISTYPKMRIRAFPSGTNTNAQISFFDNAATPASKSGALTFIAQAATNTVQMTLGQSSAAGHSMFTVSSASQTVTNVKTCTLIAIANQSVPVLEIDGITNAGGTESDKFQVYPKGYISVKPSGGASQSPTTGSSAITPSWSNKPGASTSGTATWFPMLSTTGALFWVPGFAD